MKLRKLVKVVWKDCIPYYRKTEERYLSLSFVTGEIREFREQFGRWITKKSIPIYHYYEFRKDPVPKVSKWKSYFRNWYKNPRTYQELKLSCVYPELSRKRRTKKYLPTSWEDIPRGDIRTRKSWKNKKIKKQWMKNLKER